MCDSTNCQTYCQSTNKFVFSCPANQYLSLTDPICAKYSLGKCQPKTDTLCSKTYYVGNLTPNPYTDDLTTFPGSGTLTDPYLDLIYAIEMVIDHIM